MKHGGLFRWIDSEKDQSYFLSALTPEQLKQALFPIGHLQKSEVREIARKAWLPNAERKDSQGLCFVGKVNFAEFLKSHIPEKKWQILDTSWKILGEHDGAFQYTIGQRKGIAVGGWPALFVLEKDVKNNVIIVWPEDDPRLFRTSCVLTDMNWLVDVKLPLQCEAQIRYRQKAQSCHVNVSQRQKAKGKRQKEGIDIEQNLQFCPADGGIEFWIVEVTFDTPQRAITPGQVCALYDSERVLGSGIIDIE